MDKIVQFRLPSRKSKGCFQYRFSQTVELIGLIQPSGILIEGNQTGLDFVELIGSELIAYLFWEILSGISSKGIQAQVREAIGCEALEEFIHYEVDVLKAGDTVGTIDFPIRSTDNQSGQIRVLIPEGCNITNNRIIVTDITLLRLAIANSATSYLTGVSLRDKIARHITKCYRSTLTRNKADLEAYVKVALFIKGQEQQEVHYWNECLFCRVFKVLGIALEYYQKVFVIFRTLQACDRQEYPSLNLAIIKEIVETQGGRITSDSQIGTGSTFSFTWTKQCDQ